MKGILRRCPWCTILILILVLILVTTAGCLDEGTIAPAGNETEAAIEIALADTEVQENIPVDTGAYEVVSVGPGGFESAGPKGSFSWRGMEVALRVTNLSSIYHVFVDVPNHTVMHNHSYWQWIKTPMPCMQTGPPAEYDTLEGAAAAPGPKCRLAVPYYVPEGYGFSEVQVFGEPCPRRQIYYTSADDTLRLVQTGGGDPPWAFAISAQKYSTVMVNGREAKVVKGTGEIQLAWTTEDNTSYWLWGNLEPEEMRRVAQSVSPFKKPAPEPL